MSSNVEYNFISNYYKSFSGTDTLVFILMPGSNPVILGAITTVSYSQYRTKQPVINLGRTNINGVTRGARIFAGTMIFTLINQHWLNDLTENENLKWLSSYEDLKTDELPLFDLMIASANEYGSYVSMFIYGVDITDEGQVISVEDLFTENTLSFVARDISTFKSGDITGDAKVVYKSADISEVVVNNFYIFENNKSISSNNTREASEDITKYQESLINNQITKLKEINSEKKRKSDLKNFVRELQYRPYDLMVGDDVTLIQTKLKQQDFLDNVNHIYDKRTEDAVKQFQSSIGSSITGVVDSTTYLALIHDKKQNENASGIIINESGTRVYDFPNIHASIIDTIPYNSIFEIHNKIPEQQLSNPVTKENFPPTGHMFYQIEKGFVSTNDIYSYEYSNKDIAFPTINLYETGPYVTLLQSLLTQLNGDFEHDSGVYDDNTIDKIKQLQKENDIACILGIVNEDTWRFLHAVTGNTITDIVNDKISVKATNPQGRYSLNVLDINTELMKGFDVTVNSPKATTVKCSVIIYYRDNSSKVISKSFNIIPNIDKIIEFSEFQNAFIYNIKKGFPTKIEYVVYPYNNNNYKWIIDYRGE